jgi:hypothetical protein
MRKMFWVPDFRSSQRARQSCSTKCSDTFTGVDALGEQLKPFVGVVSGVEDMGEAARDGRRWRVSIDVND